jgi:polysaccharide export outer membrane protein
MTSSLLTRAVRLLRPFAFAAAILLLAGGCNTTPTTTGFPVATDATAPTVLVPGDVIGLQFSGAPDLNQSQKIRPDGKITLPLIGEIAAAGKGFAAFQQELADQYKHQLKNTEVDITLEGSAARSIVVDGAVQKPGPIPCDRPLTAFEAIMLAGGFAYDADMRKVQIIRLVNGEHRSMFLDLRKAMSGAPTPAVSVQAGDIIFVPEQFF